MDSKDGVIKGYPNSVVTDLPGIYSLSPYTNEEVVSRRFILEERPSAIINIIDATVDAHFFEYDIGDDLTLKIEPMLQTNFNEMAYGYGKCSTGVSLKLKF